MKQEVKITSGIYLVVDPSMEEEQLLSKIEKAISAKPCAVQVWDNFKSFEQASVLISKITALCRPYGIPVLMNNHPEWVESFNLDGVHFDELKGDQLSSIQPLKQLGKIIGVTVNNDLKFIESAIAAEVDYLSFCSMFPSATASSCELVDFETVTKTRELTSIPIFLAGGISAKTIPQLNSLAFDGIAVVSGVMSSSDPHKAISIYKHLLDKQFR